MTEQARAVDRIATSRIVERLSELHPKLIDLSTERIERLLRDLGYPHLELPNVIHVAGTNGKGSTCAFLRALLNEAGYSVNVYTSPHLVSFTERVRLNDAPITEDAFLSILEHCERVNDGRQITFFEMLTAAAFLAF
ncbi:MAG: bifunctional folylpolyglutamate synthase/dihydrofolate synthase, partial [Rhodospirillales bacterium]